MTRDELTFDELRARARIDRGGYRVFDGEFAQMSVTLEDAEFLYALVRLVKPKRVLELGTGLGVSGRFIAEALAANGNGGHLLTFEPQPDLANEAERLLKDVPASVIIDWEGDKIPPPDLVFIDSGYQHRPADIREWLTNGCQALVVVHDATRAYVEIEMGVGAFLPCSDGMWVGTGKR